jgi:branched-chain amino acid transport system substrate-binding protein
LRHPAKESDVSKKPLLASVVLAAAVAVSAAGGATRADPGVDSDSILIGGTAPLSGEASSGAGVARGAEAYFKYVNGRGGVQGRKIEYKYLDDGYDPGRTVQGIRQLVQQDRVFAIFNTLGTSNNLAIRPFLNQAGVPQLFVASGASTFGKDAKRYPWTIGYIPTYSGEGAVYGRYIVKTRPKAKIAVLYQDDEYGRELVAGLKRGLGKRSGQIVRAIGYDPTASDVRSQIARLKASRANTLMIFAFGKFSIQSFIYVNLLGWRPQIFVNAVASASSLIALSPPKATNGAISIVFGKDPASKQWAKDPGMKLFRQIMARYAPDVSPNNGYYAAGMASAYTMVDALRRAGKNPTRKTVLFQATHMKERKNPFLLPGIVLSTGGSDRFPVSQVRLQRWGNGGWTIFGPLLTANP